MHGSYSFGSDSVQQFMTMDILHHCANHEDWVPGTLINGYSRLLDDQCDEFYTLSTMTQVRGSIPHRCGTLSSDDVLTITPLALGKWGKHTSSTAKPASGDP